MADIGMTSDQLGRVTRRLWSLNERAGEACFACTPVRSVFLFLCSPALGAYMSWHVPQPRSGVKQ